MASDTYTHPQGMPSIGLSQNAIEDLAASGLTWQDIKARAVGPAELAATGAMAPGVEGYVIPYFDMQGNLVPYYRVKNLNMHAGPKYRAIKDMPNHIYFPPLLPKLLAQPQHRFMIITEGEKKAAMACKMGFPAVALSGVDNWRTRTINFPGETEFKPLRGGKLIQAKIPQGDSNALVLQETGIIAVGFSELVDWLVGKEMEAIIIFDSDGPEGVKSQVQRAAATLGYELRYRGLPISSIRQLILPCGKGAKVGLDDYLVRQGASSFAVLLRACRKKRMAFPRHPNPKVFVAARLQKARLSRKETQDVALSILMELETRGRRLRNSDTQELFYFSQLSHNLMPIQLNNIRTPMHETAFGAFLYKEFNLAAIDQKVVAWLAAQLHGEPGVEEAQTHRVICRPPDKPDCIAYQLSDSHFIIITPDPEKPYIICENGEYGVLFEQGHVAPLNHTNMEVMLEDFLDRDDVLWADVVEAFDFVPAAPASGIVPRTEQEREEFHKQGRLLAVLLYYMSPWLLRWRGTQLPVEMIIGEPGSGKSSLYALRQTIISGHPRLSNMTNDIKDWYAGITAHGGLHVLDNVHFTGASKDYQQRLSDELCRLVTEPAPHIELRRLYTTSDVLSLPVNTTFAITAIEQPFFTTDLIQRSAIFELQAISGGHDALWNVKQLDRAGGRPGWVAHQLAVLHKFLRLAVHEGEWDDNFKAGHRLANYEQALTLMARVLGLPSDWIPAALSRQAASKMSDTDWVMAGIADFVQEWRAQKDWETTKFSARDIGMWAEGHESHCKNAILVNGWKLGKYLRSHRGALRKNLRIVENGMHMNKTMYSVLPEEGKK